MPDTDTAPRDVDALRAAARALLEAAQKASPGPWGLGNTDTIATDVEQSSRGSYSCTFQIAELEDDDRWRYGNQAAGEPDTVDNPAEAVDDGRYIVLTQPAVGLALADWLEAAAVEGELSGTVDPEPLAVAKAILAARDDLETALKVAEGVVL